MAAVCYVTSRVGLNEIPAHLVFVGQSVLPASLACHKAGVFLDELTVVNSAGHSSLYYRSQRRMHVFLKFVLQNSVLLTDHCVYLLLIQPYFPLGRKCWEPN
jgi:hypothetical protein